MRFARATLMSGICLAGSCLLFWAGPLHANGQAAGTTEVTLHVRDASAAEVVAKLSELLKCPVVMDGWSDVQVSIHVTGTRTDVIRTVGRALDADAREGKRGAVLLVPKFERGGLPQANSEQLRAFALTALRTLPACVADANHEVWGNDVRKLAKSLDTLQVGTLASGGTLPYAQLRQDQQEQLARCVNGRLYGGPRYFYGLVLSVANEPERSTIRLAPQQRTLLYVPSPSSLGTINTGILIPERMQP